MNPKDLIRAGRLPEAREQLTAEVKSSPSDVSKRVLLLQVLSFYGEWDKAERHLDVIVSHDSSSETGVQVYKNLINAEKERKDVLARKRIPGFLTGTPAYLDLYFAAWEKLNEKKIDEASALYKQVDAQRPTISGTMNFHGQARGNSSSEHGEREGEAGYPRAGGALPEEGATRAPVVAGKSFRGFKDTDTFLSAFLEAIVHDRYIWFPFESLRELSVSPPKTLFDLLWSQARVVTWEGLTVNCYLPVLYPDSSLHKDDRVKLGRMTDWLSLGGPFSRGMGQHVYGTDEEEMAILELRDVVFHLPAPTKKG
jgi:type VI secretion system protein ImpE